MTAAVYGGPRQVSVKDVPDARIERPTDVLVQVTSANICGSDLHMYEGRTDFEVGRSFGHENLGKVVEVGAGVDKVRVGDWVVLPFNNIAHIWRELRERPLQRTARSITRASAEGLAHPAAPAWMIAEAIYGMFMHFAHLVTARPEDHDQAVEHLTAMYLRLLGLPEPPRDQRG